MLGLIVYVNVNMKKLDYKWVALSNTTLGMLMATINASILLIALPDIFRGIGIDPLAPGNTSYLLWLILGFMVVMAVLLVSLGRLGDIYGRVRMFNLGFAVFTVVLDPALGHLDARQRRRAVADPDAGRAGRRRRAAVRELERDPHRRVPAEPARPRARRQLDRRRSPARSSASCSAACSPRSRGGWSSSSRCRSASSRRSGPITRCASSACARAARIDWWGNATFALGLVGVMIGITYGIQPYGGHDDGLDVAVRARHAARRARRCSPSSA